MISLELEQAVYGGRTAGGYQVLARSPGFREEWLAEGERLCTGFGERPAGIACPACIFAQPLGRQQVAVVQAADQGDATLAFRLLVLSRQAYAYLGGDPFLVAEYFPPPWQARGDLPALIWPGEPLLPRIVEQVQHVLQRDEGPSLLGGAQALVDGGRLVFERPAPDTELLRDLWTLLPTSTRSQLWPASFAFGNALGFDVLIVPRASAEEYAAYLSEQQAGDYPEGRYELALQTAAEAGDQRELDILFARRSRAETWRLGWLLLGLVVVLVVVGNWLFQEPSPPPAGGQPARAKLELPAAGQYPALSRAERKQLTKALTELAGQVGVRPLPRSATPERLLAAVAERLGKPDPRRDPGEALTKGPVERRLRALLWVQDVPGYQDPKLKPVDLVQRLQRQVGSGRSRPAPPRS